MRTYKIELRMDFVDESKHDQMIIIARQTAQELVTAAYLMMDKRKPLITLETGDMFEGNKEIEVVTPTEGE